MNQFQLQQHATGQIYISRDGDSYLHARLLNCNETEIQVGVSKKITIDKLYGVVIFMPIRVSLDVETCEWVIERKSGSDDLWQEVARIPGQLESDFENVESSSR